MTTTLGRTAGGASSYDRERGRARRPGRLKAALSALGPGIVMAGAAIGGSHLVQSTRAGADYGFGLVWAVVVALVLKYPFMEFAPRYTSATGESFLQGYLRVGRWAVWIFLIFTCCTMVFVTAALLSITAGLAASLIPLGLSEFGWRVAIAVACVLILAGGGYPALDRLMKVIVVLLALLTMSAVAAAIATTPWHGHLNATQPPVLSREGIAFVVALMGWMPSILDISVWYSLWALERRAETNHAPTLGEALFDFNLGYIDTAVMAFAFLALGALIMFGSGQQFSANGGQFSQQVVALYEKSLGTRVAPIIAVAALLTMFSTTITVFDAYPRVLKNGAELLVAGIGKIDRRRDLYFAGLAILFGSVLLMLTALQVEMKQMVDLATTLSFLTTPVLAYISYRVIMLPNLPSESAPPPWLKALSWVGIGFWSVFALIFIGILL